MRSIKQSSAFKRDMKRESKGEYRHVLKENLYKTIEKLANDILLDPQSHDHALSHNLKEYRECHIGPDLILLYRKTDAGICVLRLDRLGTHREVLGIE